MHEQLSLNRIRNVLVRLEETIIFGLIERAQFLRNLIIYEPDGVGEELGGESLVGFMLRECEQSHAKVRRYTSPDEHPFYNNLPDPILPGLPVDNPLAENAININARIRDVYEKEIIPFVCRPGDDRQYGSSAVNDVMNLQALSKRIHYGKFVAESKYLTGKDILDPLIDSGDTAGILSAITDEQVEQSVLDRVYRKTRTYGQELESGAGEFKVKPEAVRTIYER